MLNRNLISWLLIFLWVMLKCFGLLLMYAAIFLYENEEGWIQNRLEEWWRRLSNARNRAVSRSAAFMRETAEWMRKGFNRIYGDRIIPLRILGVSIYFSLASLCLCGFFAVRIYQKKPFPFGMLFEAFIFIGWGLVPALGYRWLTVLWYLRFVWGIIELTPFAIFVNKRDHALAVHMLTLIAVAVGTSFMFNIPYVALMRWLLKRTATASTNRHVYYGVLAMFTCILLILMLAVGPVLLGTSLLRPYRNIATLPKESLIGYAAIAAIFSSALNSVSLAICLLCLTFATMMVLHRLLWPVLQRPLYALKRYEVIKRKKLLWTSGIALLLLTPPQWSWRWLLEFLGHAG